MPRPMPEEKNNCPYVRIGKDARMGVVPSLPAHVRVNKSVGGVCMWARTDSPTTHHFPAINSQLTSEVFNLVVD